MLDLPPVRMGLLTKLNLLTIGLIFLTAVAITVFYANQRWRDDEQQLRARGAALASVMTELAEYALYTSDKASLEQILDGIGADPDVAYVGVLDREPAAARRAPLHAELRRARAARPRAGRRAARARAAAHGRARARRPEVPRGDRAGRGRRTSAREALAGEDNAVAAHRRDRHAPLGYIRLGLTFEVQRKQFREQMVGAIGVVSLLVVIAVVATLLLTRRLVAPMRRLMRAARAVGAGPARRLRAGRDRPTSWACSRTPSIT